MSRRVLRRAGIAVVALSLAGWCSAATLSETGSSTTSTWQAETGQSIPTGTGGFVDGTLNVTAGTYTFIYGGGGLVGGDTGHGNSTSINEFWVGSSESAAEAAGQVFCSQPGDASCSSAASTVGSSFTIVLPDGTVPFGFTFGPTNSSVLVDGQSNNDIGAYLVQIGSGGTAFAGPGSVAFLGLSDAAYPGDHDFQDLVVRVNAIPEPASFGLVGAALLGLAILARRRKSSAV